MIAIIAILIALLVPAVQKVREAAARSQCQNNLRQIAIACHSYENQKKTLPPGGMSGPGIGYSASWMAHILPNIEQNGLYDQFDFTAAKGRDVGVCYRNASFGHLANAQLVKGKVIPIYFCPASTLNKWGLTGIVPEPGNDGIFRPTYCGIAGADNHPSTVNYDNGTDQHNAIGKRSFGGCLVSNAAIRLKRITDGTSNTILVAEQSNWCVDSAGDKKDCRSDFSHGFPMGCELTSTNQRDWNITTVRYGVNQLSYNLKGIGDPLYACNRPIQSIHPGGANIALADGSVRMIFTDIDLTLLKNLSNRDDEAAVSAP